MYPNFLTLGIFYKFSAILSRPQSVVRTSIPAHVDILPGQVDVIEETLLHDVDVC